jgi:hypothetical protein
MMNYAGTLYYVVKIFETIYFAIEIFETILFNVSDYISSLLYLFYSIYQTIYYLRVQKQSNAPKSWNSTLLPSKQHFRIQLQYSL